MSDSTGDKDAAATDEAKAIAVHDDDHLEDEEKILAGRADVNIPAMLTKDVPGG